MKRFKELLFVVEPEGESKAALERAVTLAENNQASLTVAVVIPPVADDIGQLTGDAVSTELQATMVRTHKQKLETLVESVTDEAFRPRCKIETKVLVGVPFLEIIHEVLRCERDLVIKIPENQDWLDRLFGSDDMHLLRKCPCPVWLIKPPAKKNFRRIMVAVDVDDSHPPEEVASQRILNQQIIEVASSLALADFAELHVVHAWDAIGENAMRSGAFTRMSEQEVITYVAQVKQHHKAALDGLLKDIAGKQGEDAEGEDTQEDTKGMKAMKAAKTTKAALDYIKPQKHLVKGWARKEIPALAKQIDADLLVMGTVARTGVPGFIIGNTAETILNQIDCSVLAIKPPGFVTPVSLDD